jgi:hypothetical protein
MVNCHLVVKVHLGGEVAATLEIQSVGCDAWRKGGRGIRSQ